MINLTMALTVLIFCLLIPSLGVLYENGLFIRDWRTVWTHRAIWNMTDYGPEGSYEYEEYVWYEIRFSPSRKKYKIRMRGIAPKEHPYYKTVINKLNEFYEWAKKFEELWNQETPESLKKWFDEYRETHKYEENQIKEDLSRKVPVRKGCKNKMCYCTGDCNVIVGYRDKLPGEL